MILFNSIRNTWDKFVQSTLTKSLVGTEVTPRDPMGRVKTYTSALEKGDIVKMPNLRMFDSAAKSEMCPLDTKDAQFLPMVPDGPNCQHNRRKNYEADFTKPALHTNPARPGQKFLNLKGNEPGLGQRQTPINLESNIPILDGFVDSKFSAYYGCISADDKVFSEKND